MSSQFPAGRELLTGLVGRQINTVTGKRNTVLEVRDTDVLVATGRSPGGQPVPIDWIESALERLEADGEIEVSAESLGHRSAFVGAVLLTLPEAQASASSPPRIRITADTAAEYRHEAAGDLNVWWQRDAAERFWLEITDRPDIGIDLHCPQRDAGEGRTPGYSLIWWVEHGDIVFHYDKGEQAITRWSRAIGNVIEAPVVWLSHRGATRRRLGAARSQPGWWLDLEGPYPLEEPLTLSQLRESGSVVRAVLDDLQQRDLGSLYFPFFFYAGTTLRPMQPYLNKLPAALVSQFAALSEAANTAFATTPLIGEGSGATTELGGDYRIANVSSLPDTRDPYSVDPAVVERGLRGHADTQNELADAVSAAGSTPLSPTPADPDFDLVWQRDDTVYVAEIKSTTPDNEERQLRLGLGQVLRYRSLLAARGHAAVAVLVAEAPVVDGAWHTLCAELDVRLVTPADFGALFE